MNKHNAVQAIGNVDPMPIDLIAFQSTGRLLIIGDDKVINSVIPHLTGLDISCVCDNAQLVAECETVTLMEGSIQSIEGWLGDFTVRFVSKKLSFDLILDLSPQAILKRAVLPLGYFAPKENSQALAEAIQQLPNLKGQFDKPRYFNYQASICAHSRSQLSGCNQCLQACPAEAISSTGDTVTVNPYLCQGCGSCTAVCPSGAISYALPTLDVSLNRLRSMLQIWFEYDDSPPHLVIHDLAQGQVLAELMADNLADNIILFAIEEIGALAIPFWLSALAYGASAITVWDAGSHSDHDWAELQQEVVYTNKLLTGLGYTDKVISFFSTNEIAALDRHISQHACLSSMPVASFAGIDDKRQMIMMALQHLHQNAPKNINILSLEEGAAFGEIKVDTDNCTLCHACVSVCPVGALLDGVDAPQLKFIEEQCVQCGLCETACPEKVIELRPRYLFDRQQARKPRLLHEEAVFHCISCHKPFATKKMIDTMTEKLKDHAMFQGEALNRLKMCEDCRVKAMFSNN